MSKTDLRNASEASTEQQATQEVAGETEQSEVQAEVQETEGTDDLATLLAKLEEKEAEAKANYDLFLRERAELENFKRRMQRERAESLQFAHEPLIRDLLPVIDNLERAVEHAKGGDNGQPLVEGVALVLRSLLDTLERYGVSRVSAKGGPFDPSRHEAMAQVESADCTPNTVINEYRPAYLLHDRLLRPALVTIAKAPAEEKKTDD
jgi:molecular chaperone GrpE